MPLGGTDGCTDEWKEKLKDAWMDEQTEITIHVLQDIVPFGSAAQKDGNFHVYSLSIGLLGLRSHSFSIVVVYLPPPPLFRCISNVYDGGFR